VKEVRITWPSGTEQRFTDLPAHHTYRIVEGSPKIEPVPFRQAERTEAGVVQPDNQLKLRDTWLLEPVPLPEQQRGPGLFVLNELPNSADRREQYEIFRRYLFDWRTSLKVPFSLLLNDTGHAVKVYAGLPTDRQVKIDLGQLSEAKRLALPFSGNYARATHRDFFKFGAAYLWAGYPQQALPYLKQVLRRTPENVRVLVLVGQIHLEANRIDTAQKYFAEASKLNSNYAEAWSGLGDVCESRNDSRGALQNYEHALALKPDLLYTWLNAGRSADKLNLSSKAEAFYRHATRIDPQSPEAANGLGLALAKQGQPQEAAQLFQKAITFKRDYAEAVNNLGVLYIQEAKINDAIAAFEYGIRVAPNEDILYLNLGRTYTRMGNVEKARQVMHELLDRKPGDATAVHALQELDGR
jgi:tetratricopeptide (TPR) repeat protein